MEKYICMLLLILTVCLSINEVVALKNATGHRVRSFHCINGNYIFPSWFCDGINDCGDASDESYGCDLLKCGVGNFTCQDSTCLSISVRCNGMEDCADSSDEMFCDHEPKFDDCEIKNGKYLCKDKLRCIGLGQVCDEEVHCFDGSDEGPSCDDYDPKICNTCYHPCFRTPSKPFCVYNETAEQYEDAHSDFGFCSASKNYCDQKCVSFEETYQCSCEENFVPIYTLFQAFYCEEKEKNKNMLIYATKGAIRAIPGYSNQSVLIKEVKENITAIAAGNEYVFWGEPYDGYHIIAKVSFSGKDMKKVVTTGIGEVNAMDIDWRTGNVYFADNVRKRIAACTQDGRRCIQIHEIDSNSIVTSITVTPRLGYMYWATKDNDEGVYIRKSEMNGQSSYNFIDEGLNDVSCLSADEASEKLYWLDAVRRKIEVIRFDNSGRKVFKSDLRINYLWLTVNARYLYWSIVNNGSIYFTGGTRVAPKIALNGTDPVLKMYGYSHSEKTTQMEAPCSWGCNTGICLMHSRYTNKTGSDCVCSNTTEIEDNGVWCRETADSIFGYHYEEHYYEPKEEVKNRSIRIILAIMGLITIISGVAFYLHRKGCLDGNTLFRHIRF